MSKEHQEGYAGKHPESAHLEEKVASALRKAVENGRITCATAHGVAKDLGLSPADIGMALDLMEVRLLRCQLGLFGYTPEKRIVTKPNQWDAQLEKDIREALKEGRLPCADAWAIARRRKVPRLTVANVCEALEIKIRPCQLGAF
ncbi:MAG: hypothetical protein KQI78_09230 [Deltaproteobacteria bacterium]|nr:hypothetical protein [Deltaproteobacteria bacterium]